MRHDISALVFDLDGTLYCQRTVRRNMLLRLLRSFLPSPNRGLATMRLLRSYRHAQEMLRTEPVRNGIDLRQLQIRKACELCRTDEETARATVEYWMETNPLDLLRSAMRPGVAEFLENVRAAGLAVGLLSDYPADAKLQAMGIRTYFDAVVCAQDHDVQCFKPNPAGLLAALNRLRVVPGSAMYIGDRPGIDDVTAARAGTRAALIATTSRASTTAETFPGFLELSKWLFD